MHRAVGLGSVSEGKQPHFNSEKLRKRIFIFSIRVSSDVEKKMPPKNYIYSCKTPGHRKLWFHRDLAHQL